MARKHRNRKPKQLAFRRRTAPGAAPGTIAVDPAAPRSVVSLLAFDADRVFETPIAHPPEISAHLGHWNTVWVNVDGLGDEQTIQEIGRIFHLHPLALEDVVNVHQRAKVDDYANHAFIVARMVEYDEQLQTEQVTLFLGDNFVVTFQERPGVDSIEPVRQRLRRGHGRLRSAGADYLAYSILDAIIDGYFPVLERYGELLDDLEDEVTLGYDRRTVARIHEVKSDLLIIRRALWPHREAFNNLVRDPRPCVRDETRIYLRDCYDHTVQLIDLVETYRELGADLRDLYLSSVSNRMNEIMKVLTVISTIFIPLTFIAGVYGMNFHPEASRWNMPELLWPFGYLFSLSLMVAVTIGMLFFFRRKGWLGSWSKPAKDPTGAESGPDGH